MRTLAVSYTHLDVYKRQKECFSVILPQEGLRFLFQVILISVSYTHLDVYKRQEELQPLVDAWRISNPNIVQLWWDVDNAVKTTVRQRLDTETHGIRFRYRSGMLFIVLPSGRQLCYVKPKMGTNKFGGDSVTYEGIGSTKKWERIESYGPKFVENIVQAVSRDILMYAIRTLSHCFIVGHIHDELIIECRCV